MTDPKASGIYAIRNTVNGKLYVGSAINIARRWAVHRHTLKTGVHRCKPLQRAWDKHGKAVFLFEVIELVDRPQDLISREQHWLDTLDCHCERNGYNVCPTAQSRLGMKMPESAKLAIGLASRGRTLTAEQKAAISAVHKGKTISQAQRVAHSLAMRGRKQSPEWVARRAAAHRALHRSVTAEHREAISAVHGGKIISQAHIEAVRKAHLGRPKSAAQKAKQSATMMGRACSAATRAKISATKAIRTAC